MNKSVSMALAWLLPAIIASTANGRPASATIGSTGSVLPLQLIDNRPFTDVRINGNGPFSFIVDTGSSITTISADLSARQHLPQFGAGKAGGAGEKAEAFRFSHIADATVGPFSLGPLDAPAIAGGALAQVIGFQHLDGVLGTEIFSHHVVSIDAAGGKLIIQNPADFHAQAGAIAVPFTLDEDRMPIVAAKVAGIDGLFQIDTGDRSSLTLFDDFWRAHQLERSISPTVTAMTGYGRGGPILGIVGRSPGLVIGGLAIAPPVTRLSLQKSGSFTRKDRAGSIGMGVLKRFVVAFDYPHHTMWLSKGPAFDLAESYDRSGLWLGLSSQPGLVVVAVTPGSPAAKVGIKAGDVVTHAGTLKAAAETLFEIRRLLQDPDSESVLLAIARKGGEQQIHLILKDQIAPPAAQWNMPSQSRK